MNQHDYCTLFDGRFIIQALTLWQSILRHEPTARFWVLALDRSAEEGVALWRDSRVQVVPLAEIERSVPGLKEAEDDRSRAEYIFTLSPCWPLWLLENRPEIQLLAYLDTDMAFFGRPETAWDELGGRHVLITPHRFPPYFKGLEVHGVYNVGLLLYRRSPEAVKVLKDWRRRCLEWCRDIPETHRYADQKYLDAWPAHFGEAVAVSTRPGTNLGPWNWFDHDIRATDDGPTIDGEPLTLYHFAGFKHVAGKLWDSGQSYFGPMPRRERRAVYGAYVRWLEAARLDPRLEGRHHHRRSSARSERHPLRKLAAWLAAGSLWFDPEGACIALGSTRLGRLRGRNRVARTD